MQCQINHVWILRKEMEIMRRLKKLTCLVFILAEFITIQYSRRKAFYGMTAWSTKCQSPLHNSIKKIDRNMCKNCHHADTKWWKNMTIEFFNKISCQRDNSQKQRVIVARKILRHKLVICTIIILLLLLSMVKEMLNETSDRIAKQRLWIILVITTNIRKRK